MTAVAKVLGQAIGHCDWVDAVVVAAVSLQKLKVQFTDGYKTINVWNVQIVASGQQTAGT